MVDAGGISRKELFEWSAFAARNVHAPHLRRQFPVVIEEKRTTVLGEADYVFARASLWNQLRFPALNWVKIGLAIRPDSGNMAVIKRNCKAVPAHAFRRNRPRLSIGGAHHIQAYATV